MYIFIFRRDLRLYDNSSWIDAVKRCRELRCKLLPIFIFNAKQMDPEQNLYYCDKQAAFMLDAIAGLAQDIKGLGGSIVILNDDSCVSALERLQSRIQRRFKGVAFNADLTPYARTRDDAIQRWCQQRDIECNVRNDEYTLLPLEKIRNNRGAPFDLFIPYWRKVMHATVRMPVESPLACIKEEQLLWAGDEKQPYCIFDLADSKYKIPTLDGSKTKRQEALEILECARRGAFKSYNKKHDDPNHEAGSTHLSAYIKFGCVSIREVYNVFKLAYGRKSKLVENLFMREFNYGIAHAFPNEILAGQNKDGFVNLCLHARYEKASDKYNKDASTLLQCWCDGKTGVPIIDAAMRCLKETGWINNRLRMVAAMFLSRELNIDWREGERYFATKLLDYDPILNNAGWFGLLSHRRPMNPYKVAGKYDSQCTFIKRWVPELRDVPVLDIICWFNKSSEYASLPQPMIAIQGYRVKMKTYIPDYVRPKNPDLEKRKKVSKYAGGVKNRAKYDKNGRQHIKRRVANGPNLIDPKDSNDEQSFSTSSFIRYRQ